MGSGRRLGSTMGSTTIALLVLLGLLNSAFATLYRVGGNSGWIELSQGATPYDDQFNGITLVVGDQLQFPYTQGAHDVYQVNPTQLADCDGTNPIATHTAGDDTITLDSAGYWGFICAIGDHCSAGAMHLAVNVSAASAPTPAPTTAPVQAPVATPVQAPVEAPTSQTPTPTPSRAPTPTPSRAPTPTPAPTPSRTQSPSETPASPPEFGLSPSESLPAEAPNSGAHSSATASFAVLLASAAACVAILVV